MANGSFGLSGLPTAPTTVGSAPNNPFTPVSAVVNSTAGFEAGDLIYNFGGDIGPVPGTSGGTGTFVINDTAPTYTQNVTFGELMPTPVPLGYNNRGAEKLAVLTDGNIVIAYLRNSSSLGNYPCFKVINENGTVIVAETTIQAATGQNGMISVGALTGGGFAVGWIPSNGSGTGYAIYANPVGSSCAVVKAATIDASVVPSVSDSVVQVAPRPNGSWILATTDTSNNLYHKVFDATGTQVYNWTSPTTIQNSARMFRYVVRADNSFVYFSINASGYIAYGAYNATNTVTKAFTAITTVTGVANPNDWGGATLLTGTRVLVTWCNGSNQPSYAEIDSSNNISVGPTVYSTLNTNYGWRWASPKVLANGNYILTFLSLSSAPTTNPYGYIVWYAVYNSSHVIQTTSTGNFIGGFSGNSTMLPSVVETANYIHVLGTPTSLSGGNVLNGWNNGSPVNMLWARLSATTYQTIKQNSTTVLIGNSSSLPVSGYVRSASTPSAASFYSSTTTTVTTTSTAGTILVPQTTIDTGTIVAIDTASLNDGTCLILYRLGTGGALKLAVVSPAGALLSTTTLVASTSLNYSSNSFSQCYRIAVLSDGKIAVSYVSSTDAPTLIVLSSTYAILATVLPANVQFSLSTIGYGLAALTNGRFVLVYPDSSFGGAVGFRVYNSSLTLVSGPTQMPGSTSPKLPSCTGTQSGFVASYLDGTVFYSYTVIETTSNNFQISSQQNISTASSTFRNRKMVTGPNGSIYDFIPQSATGLVGYLCTNPGAKSAGTFVQTQVAATFSSNSNDNQNMALAVTAYNEPVIVTQFNATTLYSVFNNAGIGIDINSTNTAVSITTMSLPATLTNNIISACALTGRTLLVALLNSSNQLTYFTYNPITTTYSLPLVAGVTASNPMSLSPTNGFSLVGVSSTAAPANGQGTVVINGPAQLSSSYPSTTAGQSFDFGNPVTFGAAGTISGRNVNLIGNV